MITTLIVVFLVRVSMVLLLYVDDLLDMYSITGPAKRTFPTIVLSALSSSHGTQTPMCSSSRFLYWLTLLTIIVGQFGSCVGYLTFIGSNINQLFPMIPVPYAVIVAAIVVLPASLIPRMKALYPVSMLGMLSLLSAVVAFGVYCGQQSAQQATPQQSHWTMFKWDGLFRFAGIALFASEGITAIPSVKHSLRSLGDSTTGKLASLLDLALLTMTVMLFLAGILGWDCLGEHPASIITQALRPSNVTAQFIRAALSVYILCTYPIQLFPAVEIIEDMTLDTKAPAQHHREDDESTRSSRKHRTSSYDEEHATTPVPASDDSDGAISAVESDPLADRTVMSRKAAYYASTAAGRTYDPPSLGKKPVLKLVEDKEDGCCGRIRHFFCGTPQATADHTATSLAFLCGSVLRITFVVLTALVASQLQQFGMSLSNLSTWLLNNLHCAHYFAGMFISLMGWLAFGVLSFVIPPYLYLFLMKRFFATHQTQLDAGVHWEAWRERLGGVPKNKIEILSETFAEMELPHDEFGRKYGAAVETPGRALSRPSSRSTSPSSGGTRLASTPVPSVRSTLENRNVVTPPRPSGLSTTSCCKRREDNSVCWKSVWFWEQLGLYLYLVGGVLTTIAGMCMVVYEATHDSSASDTVGGHG
jgi:hypothetical protein